MERTKQVNKDGQLNVPSIFFARGLPPSVKGVSFPSWHIYLWHSLRLQNILYVLYYMPDLAEELLQTLENETQRH